MDSLLSNYASSDEEDDVIDPPRHHPPPPSSSSASFFTSLPPPKTSSSTSSLFSTIPPPKSQHIQNPSDSNSQLPLPIDSSATLFKSLPQPNLKPTLNLPESKKKYVVQFKTPMVSGGRSSYDDEDEDDEVEEKERKKRREAESKNEAPTVKSFLSSIPAPKNSKAALGALPTSGSGRRSIIEADVPSLKQWMEQKIEDASVAVDDTTMIVDNYQGAYIAGVDDSSWYQSGETYVDGGGSYGGGGYENYTGYGQYESNWIDRSGSNSMTETNDVPDIMSREMGKRRKTDIPTQIIEVKQDELMKNRPREDQVKTTGIAFGPSYQPVSSAKGKLSKLHKRAPNWCSILRHETKGTGTGRAAFKGLLDESRNSCQVWLVASV